jgi:hypothetical protein
LKPDASFTGVFLRSRKGWVMFWDLEMGKEKFSKIFESTKWFVKIELTKWIH